MIVGKEADEKWHTARTVVDGGIKVMKAHAKTGAVMAFIAGNWWWLIPVIILFTIIGVCSFVLPVVQALTLSTETQSHNNRSAVTTVQTAGVVSASDYTQLGNAAVGTNIPWQVLAVLSNTGTLTVGDDPHNTYQPYSSLTVSHPHQPLTVGVNKGGGTPAENAAATPLEWALLQVGKPYTWGGAGPASFDCTGLVYAAARQFGVTLPRTQMDRVPQAYGAQQVPFEQRRQGDIVGVNLDGGGRSQHVVIVLDRTRLLEAHGDERCRSGSTEGGNCVVRVTDGSWYWKSGNHYPYVVRIPGFANGTEKIEATPSGSHSGQSSSVSSRVSMSLPQFTGGKGRFHLDTTKKTVQQYSDAGTHYQKDATFITRLLSRTVGSSNFAVGIVNNNGVWTEDRSAMSTAAIATVKRQWVSAISSLPIVSMNQSKAEQVFDTARTLYMGNVDDSTSSCRVVPQSHNNIVNGTPELRMFGGGESGQKTVTLDDRQKANVLTIVTTLAEADASEKEMVTTLMVALVESNVRNYANTNIPVSLTLKHDAVGSDHDSLGIFQQRAGGAWGTPQQIMDIRLSTLNFLGAAGRPATAPGIRQIEGRDTMDEGTLAQTVQVSAYPDRYAFYKNAAKAIIDAMGTVTCGGDVAKGSYRLPVAKENFAITSPFGYRSHPLFGVAKFHEGIDISGGHIAGTSIVAVADGTVTFAGPKGGYGNYVCIAHDAHTQSCYAHMYDGQYYVKTGDHVPAGHTIGLVGSAGWSTGAHLHFEIRIDGDPVDPVVFLTRHNVQLPN